MIPFLVTIRTLGRNGFKGRVYRREFTALAEDYAARQACDQLRSDDDLEENLDFEIIGVMPA